MCGEKTVPNVKDSLEGFGFVEGDGVMVKAEELIPRTFERFLSALRMNFL
jgi:hypothetical protein